MYYLNDIEVNYSHGKIRELIHVQKIDFPARKTPEIDGWEFPHLGWSGISSILIFIINSKY